MSEVTQYYNNNPKDRNVADCAPRALSFFTGLSWESIMRLSGEYYLKTGKNLFSAQSSLGVIENNWMPKEFKCVPFYNLRKRTIKEFIDKKAKEKYIYLLDTGTHLTIIKDNRVLDTWDCSNKVFLCGFKMPIDSWDKAQSMNKNELYEQIKKNLTN